MTSNAASSLCISLVSYHAPEGELDSVIESLLEALAGLPPADSCQREIVLIDNSEQGDLDASLFARFAHRLEQLACKPRLIQGQGNVGYGSGHNLAIAQSASRYHLLMNSDVALDGGALAAGLEFLAENPEVAAVGPRAVNAEGEQLPLCKRFPSVFDFFLRGFAPDRLKKLFSTRLSRFEMHGLSETEPTRDVPILSGCFMLCRTEALQKVAGFDEGYFLYFEDFDLSMRLNRQYTLAYLPSMKILHRGGNTARKGMKHLRLFIQSGIRFFNTYGWRWC